MDPARSRRRRASTFACSIFSSRDAVSTGRCGRSVLGVVAHGAMLRPSAAKVMAAACPTFNESTSGWIGIRTRRVVACIVRVVESGALCAEHHGESCREIGGRQRPQVVRVVGGRHRPGLETGVVQDREVVGPARRSAHREVQHLAHADAHGASRVRVGTWSGRGRSHRTGAPERPGRSRRRSRRR